MSVYLYARVSTDKQENLFPVCVGVDRISQPYPRTLTARPRVRGGEPPWFYEQPGPDGSSPCVRG